MKKPSGSVRLFFEILFVRLRFLLVFIAIGFLVGKWDWIMNHVNRWTRSAGEVGKGSTEFEWYCPMHPAVVRDRDGKCPVCGMPLSVRKHGEKTPLPPGVLVRHKLSPQRVRQAGVATEEIRYLPLEREIHTAGSIEFDERRITDVSARIAGRADELYVSFTGARVMKGDRLYRVYSPDLVTTQEEYLLALKAVDAIAARPQHEEEAVARARSLADAARGRLLLWGISPDQVEAIEKTRRAETHLTVHSPVSGVVYKKDIHAGHFVEMGADPYTIADDSVVWFQAEVFEGDIGLVREGLEAEISAEAHPGEVFRGIVAYIQPTLAMDTRTVKVRIELPNPDGKLKPGMYAAAVLRIPLGRPLEAAAAPPAERKIYVCDMHPEEVFAAPGKCQKCGDMVLEERKLPAGVRVVYVCPDHPQAAFDKPGVCPVDKSPLHYRLIGEPTLPDGRVLAVPVSAVIDGGLRRIVFREVESGTFEAVEVVLGPRAGGHYQVLAGLLPGERVVSAGAFLLDAEARLDRAASVTYFGASGKEGQK